MLNSLLNSTGTGTAFRFLKGKWKSFNVIIIDSQNEILSENLWNCQVLIHHREVAYVLHLKVLLYFLYEPMVPQEKTVRLLGSLGFFERFCLVFNDVQP